MAAFFKLRSQPVDLVASIVKAIAPKATHYDPAQARRTILGVRTEESFRLSPEELEAVADYARRTKVPFREIWIVDGYGTPAQRVPYRPAGCLSPHFPDD